MAESVPGSPVVQSSPECGSSSVVHKKTHEGTSTTFSFTSDCTVADKSPAEGLEDAPVCWICLDPSSQQRPLILPCKCPRYCHGTCLARWQLQSAGTRRETHCEFCDGTLPDWRRTLTPDCGANAPAIMNVNFDGRTYSFEVKPGAAGYLQFTEAIRHAFQLPSDSELNITFTCDEPCSSETAVHTPEPPPTGNLLTLQGAGAYDAAVYCASVSAARRQVQQRLTHRTMSSPGLSLNSPENDTSSAEPPLSRAHTLGQLGHVFRPEDFIAQAQRAQAQNRSHSARSLPVMPNAQHPAADPHPENNRPRGWSRMARKIKSLFSRMVNKS